MKEARLIFPHQLFKNHPLISALADCYLIEVDLFFTQFAFHKQKIAFHRASMKAFACLISDKVKSLNYIGAQSKRANVSALIDELANEGFEKIVMIDVVDDWLHEQINQACECNQLILKVEDSPMFLNSKTENDAYFLQPKKSFLHHNFYQRQRRHLNLLMEGNNPLGGKWSFDQDNRKKYPKDKTPPLILNVEKNLFHVEAFDYVNNFFSENPGCLDPKNGYQITYPINHKQAELWLMDFLKHRFEEFGVYEDAMVKEELVLNHSVLTPMLNVGLLTPQQIIICVIDFTNKNNIPINSTEGFVRQVIGWREFIRGLYEHVGRQQRTSNYWRFNNEMPAVFYDGTTGVEPVDDVINKILDTGYCHHIERLMILGNFMLLCEIKPNAVYQWFMELFIDAYDWVMVPNVYGMSQFADGGLLATKPYISSSNYILKMSNYSSGKASTEWRKIWDGLFWRFMSRQRAFFESNPRIGMLLKTWDRMDVEKQQQHLETAANYLSKLHG